VQPLKTCPASAAWLTSRGVSWTWKHSGLSPQWRRQRFLLGVLWGSLTFHRGCSNMWGFPLKDTYHAIFEQYIVGPYLYKVYKYSFFFIIPNRSCILAISLYLLFPALFLQGADSVSCSWPRPPAGEGRCSEISCWAVRRGGGKEISVLCVLFLYMII